MSARKTPLSDLYPLPEGIELRDLRFGSASPHPPVRLPAEGSQASTEDGTEFELAWKDTGLGLTVLVEEDPVLRRLVASAYSTDPAHLGTAEVSVALIGSDPDRVIRVTVPLDVAEAVGLDACSGTADLGTIGEVRRRLGLDLRLLAYLMIRPGAL